MRESKESLRKQLDSLQQQQRNRDTILSALCQPHLGHEVIRRLHGGQSAERILAWLDGISVGPPLYGTGNSQNLGFSDPTSPGDDGLDHCTVGEVVNTAAAPNAPGSARQTTPRSKTVDHNTKEKRYTPTAGTDPDNPTPEMLSLRADTAFASPRHYRRLDQVLSTVDTGEAEHTCGTWTTITNDLNLVRHLLALYFCWEYPTFASLSKEHFLRDFHNGRHLYCSSILVNALLALGCRFSDHPATRGDPGDSSTAGDHFFRESRRLLEEETDLHSLTTIQALGILSIREASFGRDAESLYYAGQSIRLAFEMGLQHTSDNGDEDELAVQSATFWGAFALDQYVTQSRPARRQRDDSELTARATIVRGV